MLHFPTISVRVPHHQVCPKVVENGPFRLLLVWIQMLQAWDVDLTVVLAFDSAGLLPAAYLKDTLPK